MNSKFLTLVVVAAVIAAGTYFGLNMMFPYQKEEAKATAAVPADAVFSGGLQTPAASDAAEAAPAAAPAPSAASPAPAASGTVPTEAAAVAPQAEQPAPEPQAETKTEAPAPAPTAKPAEKVAIAEPAPEPVKPAPAPRAASAVPKPAAAPAPALARKPEPKPATKASTVEASKPAGTPPATKVAVATAAAPPPVKAKQWWTASDAGHLSLVYAGPAAFKDSSKAVVLLFNGEFDSADSANANVAVQDARGGKVAGSWKVGPSNKRMLVFVVNSAGVYTIIIKTGLKDNGGRAVAQEARGPVSVQ